MVRALLDGSKTQTRRVVKVQNTMGRDSILAPHKGKKYAAVHLLPEHSTQAITCCPYGQPGDQLWVRETFQPTFAPNVERDDTDWQTGKGYQLRYSATDERVDWMDGDDNITRRCKPAIHMPRWASRITLDITGVRVERLQDISEADCVAEGCTKNHNGYYWGGPHAVNGLKQMATAKSAYRDLWESINGPGSWHKNPWVWVVEFTRHNAGNKPPHVGLD
jgi:hypothetical protein